MPEIAATDERPYVYRKYDVKRLNDSEGKHDECWFFVLDPKHDPLAREALRAYADAAERAGMPRLASDLHERRLRYAD